VKRNRTRTLCLIREIRTTRKRFEVYRTASCASERASGSVHSGQWMFSMRHGRGLLGSFQKSTHDVAPTLSFSMVAAREGMHHESVADRMPSSSIALPLRIQTAGCDICARRNDRALKLARQPNCGRLIKCGTATIHGERRFRRNRPTLLDVSFSARHWQPLCISELMIGTCAGRQSPSAEPIKSR